LSVEEEREGRWEKLASVALLPMPKCDTFFRNILFVSSFIDRGWVMLRLLQFSEVSGGDRLWRVLCIYIYIIFTYVYVSKR